jgi:hypothetical protein
MLFSRRLFFFAAVWVVSQSGCGGLSTEFDGLGSYLLTGDAEQAFPTHARTGEGVAGVAIGASIWEVPYEVRASMAISGGDIVLGTEAEVQQRAAIVGVDYRTWPACRVPYRIDDAVAAPVRQAFYDAIDTWEASTPLRFVEDPTAPDRVDVVRDDGCWSRVGFQGGIQELSLGDECASSAIHEIGHAVGLWHEHARSDAYDYVAFHLDVVPVDKHHNFRTYAERNESGIDFGPYDFDSVMHYPPRAFSTGGRCNPTDLSGCSITRADGGYLRAGQRRRLSEGDLAGIASLYADCDASAPSDGPGRPMFARYLEGSFGNNKYLEVGNAADGAVSLDACAVELYRNGATEPATTVWLDEGPVDSLAPGETLLLCHTSAELETGGDCDLASGALSFNGDDALLLVCAGAVVDRIGRVGEDPGSSWGGAEVSTRDASLERRCDSAPQTLPGEVFDPAADWFAYPVDDATALGTPWLCAP